MNDATKQDIEINIKILKGNSFLAHIHSFLLLWYPFKGSVKEHIKYLESRLKED